MSDDHSNEDSEYLSDSLADDLLDQSDIETDDLDGDRPPSGLLAAIHDMENAAMEVDNHINDDQLNGVHPYDGDEEDDYLSTPTQKVI